MSTTSTPAQLPTDLPAASPSPLLLSAYYAIYLASLGAIAPYMGAHLLALGVTGTSLGFLFMLPPFGRLLLAPPLAALADRYRVGGWLLRIGTALSCLGAVGFWLATGPTLAGVSLAVFFLGRTTPSPALDALILEVLRARGLGSTQYGRIRLWGSVGFMAAVALAATIEAPLELGVVFSALAAVMGWMLPARAGPPPVPVMPALRRLAQDPVFGPFLLTFGLQGLTLSVYDAFYSVHIAALGLPSWVTAGSVVLGVAVEIVVMALGSRLFARFAPIDVLGAAVLLSVPRWLLTGLVHDPVLLILVQALHGLSFGGFWIAGVQVMTTRAPREIATAAQSLLVAASYGIGALAGALLAGVLDEIAGSEAIFVGSAVVSALALIVWAYTRPRFRSSPANLG